MITPPTDPVERIVFDALSAAKIDFVCENDPRAKRLDFYLPDMDLHIEVKQFHSERTGRQIERADNIILIVGLTAARHYSDLLRLSQK